jgi:hypothetical protein
VSPASRRRLLYLALALAFLVRNDFWQWDVASRWLGLPAGLTYHFVFCLVVAAILALLVRYAWPAELDARDGRSRP